VVPEGEQNPAEIQKTKRTAVVYLFYAVLVFAALWFLWAKPYLGA